MSRPARGGAAIRRGRCEMSGFTAVPRWTTNPTPGTGEHEAQIPGDLVAALHQLASDHAVPLSSVLLTAHAKVLGALSGETEIGTGYAVGARAPLPLRMTLAPGSWRQALLEAVRAESELLPRKDAQGRDRTDDRGLSEPRYETVFAPAAEGGGELAEGAVFQVT